MGETEEYGIALIYACLIGRPLEIVRDDAPMKRDVVFTDYSLEIVHHRFGSPLIHPWLSVYVNG